MTLHETRLYEARLLALTTEWHIRRVLDCSNCFEGERGPFRLELSLYDYELPERARVEARIYDTAHNVKVPVARRCDKSMVEAIEVAVMSARSLGHAL